MSLFRVWAPSAGAVSLVLDTGQREMSGGAGGWWRVEVPEAGAGARYGYRLDGGEEVLPDPRSARQPNGVHGRSEVYDHAAFPWTDGDWRGVTLTGAVLYELHVGTFTREGTFAAAIDRLDHLVDLGVDAVELLPCASFPGRHGWGYDGVSLFAVHEPYGGPDGLKRFVDAAHARGLGVIMDVVYNHLGPEGNYLARFGPYFTDTHVTPWGAAVNLDAPGSDEVRAFLLDNARSWLADYHCDGLRLDAVHAFADTRAVTFLEELQRGIEALAAHERRPLFLIAESESNDPRLIRAREAGGYGLAATWCDDVHHALHATLTGERQGYYVDFGPLPVLSKALRRAYVHDGCWSTFRGHRHGRPAGELSGSRFVTFLQNHDQVGNRAGGERLAHLVSPGLARVGAVLLLTAPYVPLLFMGEEWAASTPWQFFSDYEDPGLAGSASAGRRREFAGHGWSDTEVPDPQDPRTVQASTLCWTEPGAAGHAEMLDLYRRLISLRHRRPELVDGRRDLMTVDGDPVQKTVTVRRGDLLVAANLGASRAAVQVDGIPVEVLLSTAGGFTFAGGVVELEPESALVAQLLGAPG